MAAAVVCYISDIEHTEPWPDPALTRFVRDADLMIYDGMFSDAEYTRCQGWGHSTWHKGVELAKAAGVKSLAIFHIFPGHDDAFLCTAEAEMQTRDAHRLRRAGAAIPRLRAARTRRAGCGSATSR